MNFDVMLAIETKYILCNTSRRRIKSRDKEQLHKVPGPYTMGHGRRGISKTGYLMKNCLTYNVRDKGLTFNVELHNFQ